MSSNHNHSILTVLDFVPYSKYITYVVFIYINVLLSTCIVGPPLQDNLVRTISRLLMSLNCDGGHLLYYCYSNYICVYISDVRDKNIWKMKENGNIFTYINTLRLCKFIFGFNLFLKRIIHLFSCAPCYDTHFNLRSLFVRAICFENHTK